MTKPQNPNAMEQTPPLPGLGPAPTAASPLEVAAHRTLAGLAADGLLEERHALLAEGILSLARAMHAAERKGAATAAAHAFGQILAAFAVLVPEVGGDDPDAYDQLAADLRAAAVDSARSAAAVRNA